MVGEGKYGPTRNAQKELFGPHQWMVDMEYPEGLLIEDYESTRQEIVAFIRNYVKHSGTTGVVLGLSGGIDSALVVALACEAIGPESVLSMLMPVDASEDEANISDAKKLAESLRMEYELFELQPLVDGFSPLGLQGIALGNVKARLRMVALYGRANQRVALVLGTGNRSELKTGYFTKYGDGGADMLPIGELYKANVTGLARYIGIPDIIINKPPSAGLLPGQTDEGDLGLTYRELDSILYLTFDQGKRKEDVVALGYDKVTVEKVLGLVRRARHKTSPIPTPGTWKPE